MKNQWNHAIGVAALAALSLVMAGNDGGACGPASTPPSGAQCAAATDCDGLSHADCTGAWACNAGTCAWACDQKATCFQGGCSGEVCSTVPNVATDCVYLDWYACLKLTTCGAFGAGGACGFEQNAAFLACLAKLPCAADSDCATGQVCVAGACQAPTPTGCTADADCPSGQFCAQVSKCPACQQATPPCEAPCTITWECGEFASTKCGTDADCPVGWFCGQLPCVAPPDPPPPDYCHATCMKNVVTGCQTDSDCPSGQACRWSQACGTCDCPAGQKCNCPMCPVQQSGTCEVVVTGCARDTDCLNGEVCQANPVQPPCPVCNCPADDPACACPAIACLPTGTCVPAECKIGELGAKCTAILRSGEPCPSVEQCIDGHWVCTAIAGQCGACDPTTDPTCLPAGECWTDADCAYGETCQGAYKCPAGAECLVADHAGKCVPTTSACASDADCNTGEVCVNGVCEVQTVPGCKTDAECLVGETCLNGLCQPAAVTPCSSSADCLVGEFCTIGLDSKQCCPPGALCGPVAMPVCQCELAPGYCWTGADCASDEACQGAVKCPAGAMCLVADHPGKCVANAGCTDSSACPAGEYCNQKMDSNGNVTGTCAAVPDGTCTRDVDCPVGQACVIQACPACYPCACFGKCGL